jgi:hypothetical protein
MLFRPEEIHGASGIREVVEPLPKRDGCISNQTFRFGPLEFTILHYHSDRRSTVKTRSIDLDTFAWKKPADRQRLEPSLAEPFLLTFNGDAILGGKVVERGKRGDVVGIRKQPTGKSRGKKFMNCLSPLLGRDP